MYIAAVQFISLALVIFLAWLVFVQQCAMVFTTLITPISRSAIFIEMATVQTIEALRRFDSYEFIHITQRTEERTFTYRVGLRTDWTVASVMSWAAELEWSKTDGESLLSL